MSTQPPCVPGENAPALSALLLELGRRGVGLRRDGNEIKLRADKQALDPALLATLRGHKPALLDWLGADSAAWRVPEVPMVELSPAQMARIAGHVDGGAANIADIYPLAPLQEGLFFHHVTRKAGGTDAYLLPWLLAFDTRELLQRFTAALQCVIDRHDILRSSMAWEGLAAPVQVVWRAATLRVDEIAPGAEAGNVADWLVERVYRQPFQLDVRRAPLMHACAAEDAASGRWLLMVLCHHLIVDHTTMDAILEEVAAFLRGDAAALPAPLPYKRFVAHARAAAADPSHEPFFRRMLAGIDAPTAPFGFTDVSGDGSGLGVATVDLDRMLARQVRECAAQQAVSAASVFHLAWALVVARLSGRDDVVFGTVLFGRMQAGEGAGRVLGVCINTLPVRIPLADLPVGRALRDTHVALAELLGHEHAPLTLAQGCGALPAGAPLFSCALNYRYSEKQQALTAGSSAAWHGVEELFSEERGNYPLHVEVDDFGDGFSLTTQVQQPMDPGRVVRYFEHALAGVVEALRRAPDRLVGSIDILPPEEHRQVTALWNATDTGFSTGRYIHELFEEQVRATPEAVALVFDGEVLTYAELNARANRLARHLRDRGVGPGARVAIALPRCPAMVAAILATFKAGGTYVPLDPSYPVERLQFMLADSAPRALLTTGAVRGTLGGLPGAIEVVMLDDPAPPWRDLAATDPERQATRAEVAYIIYTSGSTGTPKGVMVPHDGACNLAMSQIAAFGMSRESRVLQFASFAFDASISELFTTFFSGAALYMPAARVLAGAPLQRFLLEQRITVATLPPAVLASLPADAGFPALRTLVLAGEKVTQEMVRRWSAPGRRLINGYGPTESTVCASMHLCEPGHVGDPPIGRPIDNTRIYLLDAHRRPVPVGVIGEIYIAGVNVAAGYLNRPELTAERFLGDPFSARADERMYKSGDLGRWLADGAIEYMGRADQQVKIRGFRIEPGEIEALLGRHPGVDEAVVLAREDASGERQLIAHYTGAGALCADALRAGLARQLPEHMVPARFVHLERLPLTANGKIDRLALLAGGAGDAGKPRYEAPVGALEKSLAMIWGRVLHLAPGEIGRKDHFLELGGQSLRAVQVAGLLHELGFDISAAALFAYPTIERLGLHLSSSRALGWMRGAIPLRPGAGERRLFLVHEVWGEAMYGPALAAHVDPDIGVYGLVGREPGEAPVDDLRDHAATLADTIVAIQASGPYHLAGWSFGGVLAYEVASQLVRRGARVAFLGLLDAAHPLTQKGRLDIELAETDANVRLLAALDTGEEAETMARLADLSRTLSFEMFVGEIQAASLLPARMSVDQIRRYLAHHDGYLRALSAYTPEPWPGGSPLHLFRVADDRDVLLGWDAVADPRDIRTVDIPGSHMTMVEPPHAEALGAALSRALGAATAAAR